MQLPVCDRTKYITSSYYCGKVGETFNGAIKSGLFLAGYTFSGKNDLEIESKFSSTVNWFNENTLWKNSKNEQ